MIGSMRDLVRKIGYQALFTAKSCAEAVEFAAENGYPVVEINLNSPDFFPEKYDRVARHRIRELACARDVKIILHAPEAMGILNLQRRVREACVARTKELVDFACQIGADRMTFHLGSSVPMLIRGEMTLLHSAYPSEYRDALDDGLRALIDYSREKVFLCLENSSGFRYGFVQEALPSYLDEGLCLTWDLGHTNYLEEEARKEETDFYIRHMNRVKVAHIHDNHGSRDEHNIIGDGSVDFRYYLSLLDSPDVALIFEVRPRENAALCRERLERLLQSGRD